MSAIVTPSIGGRRGQGGREVDPGGARARRPVRASRLQACIAPTSRAIAGRQATPMSWAVKDANRGVSGQRILDARIGLEGGAATAMVPAEGKEPARRALSGRAGSAGRRDEAGTRRHQPRVTGSTPGSATAAGRYAGRRTGRPDRGVAARGQTPSGPTRGTARRPTHRPDRKPGAPYRTHASAATGRVDEVVTGCAAGGLPGLLGGGAAAGAGCTPDRPEPRRWSGHPGGLARPAPPQPLERRERALVQRLERPRWLAAEQALRSTARRALDPPRGAGRGGVHPLQPGRAVHPRAP